METLEVRPKPKVDLQSREDSQFGVPKGVLWRSEAVQLPPLSMQYADFAYWQRQWMAQAPRMMLPQHLPSMLHGENMWLKHVENMWETWKQLKKHQVLRNGSDYDRV